MKVKLDFADKFIVDLKGKKIKGPEGEGDFSYAEAASIMLTGQKTSDAVKAFSIAQDLMKDGKVELDDSDATFFETHLKSQTSFHDLVVGQVLAEFNRAKVRAADADAKKS